MTSVAAKRLGSEAERAENRRHRRASVDLRVRFQDADGEDVHAKITDASAGGARLTSPYRPKTGVPIMLYAEKLGRLRAKVVRRDAAGFAVWFDHGRGKAGRLADALTWTVNETGSGRDKRRATRFPQDAPARMVLPCGREVDCKILDISTTGASIGTSERPAKGTLVTVGRMRAEVVRHHADGLGVLFASASAKTDPLKADHPRAGG